MCRFACQGYSSVSQQNLNLQACYWGRVGCVRLLLAADADACTRDHYGNLPSDIFDDHVPEPVADKIRSLMRDHHAEEIDASEAGGTMQRSLGRSNIFGGTLDSTGLSMTGDRPMLRSSYSMDDLTGTAHMLRQYARKDGQQGVDLHAAARDGQVIIIDAAVSGGALVDELDRKGWTPLMWASKCGRWSSAKNLLANGADCTKTCPKSGYTPLHIAAYYCKPAVVLQLMEGGAAADALDRRGKRPGERFRWTGYCSLSGMTDRRLIRQYLSGDLSHEAGHAEGPAVFPMNSPLETYDEEHQPQFIRLPSSLDNKDEPSKVGDEMLEGKRLVGIKYYLRRASVQWLPSPADVAESMTKLVRAPHHLLTRGNSTIYPDEIKKTEMLAQ